MYSLSGLESFIVQSPEGAPHRLPEHWWSQLKCDCSHPKALITGYKSIGGRQCDSTTVW